MRNRHLDSHNKQQRVKWYIPITMMLHETRVLLLIAGEDAPVTSLGPKSVSQKGKSRAVERLVLLGL